MLAVSTLLRGRLVWVANSEFVISSGAPVLALSEDFSRLLGPGPEDDVAFTADALAGRLREIAEAI